MGTAPDIPRRRAKKFPVLGCVVAGFGLIAVIVLAGIWGGLSYVDRVDARIAELEAGIRERGQPVTLDELNAYYPAVPDDENAALVYQEALSLIDASDPGSERLAPLWERLVELEPGAEIPSDLLTEMRTCLDERSEVFDVLNRATQFGQARYPVDLQQGMEVELPHAAKLRACARLLIIRGTIAAVDRDFPEYVACQQRVLHLANTLRSEPIVISQLVRAVLHSMAAEALIRDLNRTPLPPETLGELALLYRDHECSDCLSRAVAGEWCMWIAQLRATFADADVNRDVDVKFMDAVMEKTGGASVFRHLSYRRYLEILRLLEPLADPEDTSWPERLDIANDMKTAAEEAFVLNLTAQFLLPSIRAAVIGLAREAAALRMVRVVLAVEQHRDAAGALPYSLDELVPKYLSEVPLDPFDGQPLRYKRGTQGYKVYSVYCGKDDGGVQWQRATAEANEDGPPGTRSEDYGDWVFEVRR